MESDFFISGVVMKITLFDVTSRMYVTVILFYEIFLVQVATLLHRTMPAVTLISSILQLQNLIIIQYMEK